MAGDRRAGDNTSKVYFASAKFCINGRPCLQIPLLFSPVALVESIYTLLQHVDIVADLVEVHAQGV